jgi:glycerophosphoryl diester phosphodiesterase
MVRLYAHRGAAAELPENTLPSFRRALELGADALETDAQLTRDGQVVLSHDATGKRCAGVRKAIAECSLEEVWSWDVGGREFSGYKMPTLAEALLEFPDTPFNVDLKDPSPRMIPAVLEVVGRAKAEERVLLASFDSATLRAVRAAGYRGPTGMGQADVTKLALLPGPLFAHFLKVEGDRAQVPVSAWGLKLGKRSFIERCHARGLAVDFWTVDDPAEAVRLVELGADGIMTDDPAKVAPALGKGKR